MNNNYKKKQKENFDFNNNELKGEYDTERYDEFNDKEVNNNERTQINKMNIEKRIKRTGIILLILATVLLVFQMHPEDNSEIIQGMLSAGATTGTAIGTVLSPSDIGAQAKDYTITHSSQSEETDIWIWDYAAEDGDYVQVLVNGTPISEEFMIKNKPVKFTVPAVGEVKIVGVRDGGGGITYAVQCAANGMTYFNGTNVGEGNTYTLVRGE